MFFHSFIQKISLSAHLNSRRIPFRYRERLVSPQIFPRFLRERTPLNITHSPKIPSKINLLLRIFWPPPAQPPPSKGWGATPSLGVRAHHSGTGSPQKGGGLLPLLGYALTTAVPAPSCAKHAADHLGSKKEYSIVNVAQKDEEKVNRGRIFSNLHSVCWMTMFFC